MAAMQAAIRWCTCTCTCAVLLVACGGEPEPEAAASSESSGAEDPEPRRAMEVEGLMGTIPERKIQAALEPKLPKFQRCFFHGAQDVEFIGGAVEFYFRVGLDGGVEWAFMRDSSVGHRGTERCLLEEAARTKFPEPRGGGAAEFAWGFELDGLEDVRPPLGWDEGRVGSAVEEQSSTLSACGADGESFVVTVYIEPGGRVMSAGAAAPSPEASEHIDCLVEAVKGWTMPDPGSYAAKATFRVSL